MLARSAPMHAVHDPVDVVQANLEIDDSCDCDVCADASAGLHACRRGVSTGQLSQRRNGGRGGADFCAARPRR